MLLCCGCLDQIGGSVQWHTTGTHAENIMSVGPVVYSVLLWSSRLVRFPRCGDVEVTCVFRLFLCNHMCLMFVFDTL